MRALLLLPMLVACSDPSPARDYGDPSASQAASEQAGIVAQVLLPRAPELSSATVELVLSAYLRERPQPLVVTVSLPDGTFATAVSTGAPGPAQRFTVPLRLVHGSNPLSIRIATADESRIRYLGYTLRYSGTAPGLRARVQGSSLADPCSDAVIRRDSITNARRACVRGRVTVASGRTLRSLTLSAPSATPVTPAPDGTFAAAIDLPPNAATRAALIAEDNMGGRAETTVAITQDSEGPTITLEGATEGRSTQVNGESFSLRGMARDPAGVESLWVEYDGGGTVRVDTASALAVLPFTASLRVDPGANPMTLSAVDAAGNQRRVRFTLTRDRVFVLRAPPPAGASAQLDLDRFAIERLFTEADQRATNLVDVALRPALLSALQSIRDPYTSRTDTSAWRAAEWNLHRLLNMTPDTADLRGSSMENLLQIAGAIGLPPPRVLSQLLESTPTTPFVSLDVVADVLLDQLVGTHPNAQRDARGNIILRLSMYDVLQDLRPLSARYGPSGAHPGFLTGTTFARTLEAGFSMSIPVQSNLRPFEGIDLGANAKRYLYLGTDGAVLDLDFTSDRFAVVGIVDQPTVDLSFAIQESPSFARGGTSQTAGADTARPGFARGNGAVWSLQPWNIERIVAETAYRQFHNRFMSTMYARTLRYDAGSIRDAAVIGWERGWVNIRTSGGLGSPPPPTFMWDVLSEIAQTRLHDGGVAEGSANCAFTLRRLSIGLTADDLVRSLRPTLMAQRAELSRRLVGSTALAASSVDVYYVPSTVAGAPGFLFFRAVTDGPGPAYTSRGFFEDAALTRRASATGALAGTADTAHEKIIAAPGRTVFVRDDSGSTFSLTVIDATAEGPRVRVARAGAP